MPAGYMKQGEQQSEQSDNQYFEHLVLAIPEQSNKLFAFNGPKSRLSTSFYFFVHTQLRRDTRLHCVVTQDELMHNSESGLVPEPWRFNNKKDKVQVRLSKAKHCKHAQNQMVNDL
jgi:hypothetical protein